MTILILLCCLAWSLLILEAFAVCKAASRNPISPFASTVVHPCSDRDLGGLQSAGEIFPYICRKCQTAFRDPEALGNPFCCPHCNSILTTDRKASLKASVSREKHSKAVTLPRRVKALCAAAIRSLLKATAGALGTHPAPVSQITQNTGLGSNGECRQEREGLSASLECHIQHQKDRLPVPFGASVKTGYGTAEANRQVPSPTHFEPVRGNQPTQAPGPSFIGGKVLAQLFPRPSVNLQRGKLAHTSRASEKSPTTSLALSSRNMAMARRRMLVRLLAANEGVRRVA